MKLILNYVLLFILIFYVINTCSAKFAEPITSSQTSEELQTKTANNVIKRVIPKDYQLFNLIVDFQLTENTFKIKKNVSTGVIHIWGNNGVTACRGFNYYLKTYCNCHLSWQGNQLYLPKILPNVDIEVQSPNRYIYYQNVCTWSYSFVWWKWNDWRKHIDWIALSGINLVLSPIQEEVWTKIYKQLGLTKMEIKEHFSGPAFLAWQRMGNIRGWGGPMSDRYKVMSGKIQTRVIKSLRKLGISVALPGFAGHVPVAFKRLYPNATLNSVDIWNRFPKEYCCPLFLDPIDPLFQEIGKLFLTTIIQHYGNDHIFFSDPFNELQPRLATTEYLSSAAQGIYNAMKSIDPEVIWLCQGWMFVKNPFWSDNLLKAFLTAVPLGRMLILDLQSEQYPQYDRTLSYYGQPFIWCMLHNFGGTLGMHGSIDIVNSEIIKARYIKNSTMIGVGITPEGINQNYVMYDFLLDMAWQNEQIIVDQWLTNYTISRYNLNNKNLQNAWFNLYNSVYAYNGVIKISGKYTLCRRPNLKLQPWTWYNATIVEEAWFYFLEAAYTHNLTTNNLYNHDLVDLTRQNLQNIADKLYNKIVIDYQKRNLINLEKTTDLFISLLNDLDRVLGSNENFLLGKWLASAKSWGNNEAEMQLYEFNARNQITLWGPTGQINDYATKQWSGIINDYFSKRWRMFFDQLINTVKFNQTFNQNRMNKRIFYNIEEPFSVDNKIYPVTPEGNSLEISKQLYVKWININNNN